MRSVLDRSVKTYDYINRVVLTLPLSIYEGTWTTLSPLVAMHHHDLHDRESPMLSLSYASGNVSL